MADTDVVIVGGGPSGSATAIACAAAGLRVVLLEREPPGRERPGETLHPGVEPLLARLGVAEEVNATGFLRYTGHWVHWDGPPRFAALGADAGGPWRGYQAWRADFDSILLCHARRVGAVVRQPCGRVEPLLRTGGERGEASGLAGVITRDGPLEAPFVVDAAGGQHWLARHLGLAVVRHSPPLVAWYGYVEDERPSEDPPTLAADEDGWTWTARVRPGITAWTRLAPYRREKVAPDTGHPAAGTGARRRGADVTWRIISPAAGPGFFLVGDAVAVLDPASSHGVLKALMTGMMAAHLILQAGRGCAAEMAVASVYNDWVDRWFRHDLTTLRALYRIFAWSPSGSP